MKLWRIENGVPSIADALLVAGGMVFYIGAFTPIFDRVLNYFEPRGLLALGYTFLFLIGLSFGGSGFWIFFRNHQKIKEEIRFPRLVFAFAAVPLISLFHQLLLPLVWKPYEGNLDRVERDLGLELILAFASLYLLVVRLALKYPYRTNAIALWFNAGLGIIGAAAKIALLFLKK